MLDFDAKFHVNQTVRIVGLSVNNIEYGTIEKIEDDGYIRLRGIVFSFSPMLLEPFYN